MTLMNGEQYRESVKKLNKNMYKWGEKIEDVTTHPATKLHVDSAAHAYDMAFDEEKKDVYTMKSHLTGETVHRWNGLNQTAEDQYANAEMKRDQYRWSGTCTGSTCAGWTALNVLWAVTHDMDEALGTDYHERVKKYFQYVEDNALAIAGGITDGKGNRALKPSQQKDKDLNLHVKEVREDGVVLSGCKIQICGVAAAHEIIVVPGGGYKESEKDFCVAAAVPLNAEGLTIVETRRPSDRRDEEEGWDAPKIGNITQAYLLFEDVFVPNERVFMNGEYKYSGAIIANFASIYRAAIGGCVAGQGDVMMGSAVSIARANGLSKKTFKGKLTEMSILNEIPWTGGIAAMAKGKQHKSGLFVPDAFLAHLNKTQVATLPYQVKMMTQDIAGGIAETGCMPSYEDFQNPQYGEKLLNTLAAGSDPESRARIARLIEWLTVGGGIPGCMHGGGSPDGAKMVVTAFTDFEGFAADAERIAGVKERLEDNMNFAGKEQ